MTVRRRRGAELTSAIRAATLAELSDRGYAGVAFQGVAQRAGTSRSVLHRRYDSRAHLVVDALLDQSFAPSVQPPAGSLREDLIGLLVAVGAQYQRIGLDTMRALLSEADEDIAAHVAARTQELVQDLLVSRLDEARARGELGPGPFSDRVVMLPVTLLRHDLLMGATPPDRDEAAALCDDILLPLLHAVSRPQTAAASAASRS